MHAMKTVIKILLAFLLIILVCCNRTSVRIVEKAEETIEVSLHEIHLSQEMLMPTKMFMQGNNLVVYQCEGDTLFSIFSDPHSGHYTNIGIKGRGPNEFIQIDVRSLLGTNEGFLCMDAGGLKKEVVIDRDKINVLSSSMINTQRHPQNGIFVDNGYLSVNLTNEDTEFVLYKYTDNEPEYLCVYPEWGGNNREMKAFTYMKHILKHPTENKVASLYAKFRKIRILDINDGSTIEVDVRIPNPFRGYKPDDKDNHIAYGSYPCIYNDNICALCFNGPFNEDILPEIHVFDWDGNLKKRILLDKYINVFVIDTANDILYGMNTNQADILYYHYFKD